MKKQFLLSKAILTLSLALLTFSSLQAATPTAPTSKKINAKAVATTTATSTSPDKIVTANGDELCVLSNGNKIPCVYKEEAQELIKNKGVSSQTNNTKVCVKLYKEEYFSCENFNEKGRPKIAFLIKNSFFITNSQIASLTIISLIGLLIVFFYKKYEKK